MTDWFHQAIQLLNTAGEEFWRFSSAMFVQATVLVGVLAVLDVLLLRRLRASVRYAAWTLVLVKLVLPVSLSSPVSLARWMPSFDAPHVEKTATRSNDGAQRSTTGHKTMQTPSDATHFPVYPAHHNAEPRTHVAANDTASAAPMTADQSTAADVRPASSPPTAARRGEIARLHRRAWVFLSWLGVVSVLFGMLLHRVLHVRRIVGRSEPPPQGLQVLLNESLDTSRMRRERVRLGVTRDLSSPAICGFFRATVLIPHSLASRLDRSQLCQVFAHELIHWKRFDLQVNSLQTVLQILYFYHPLVWATNAVLRRLREQAVDEAVLVMSGTPADEYSTTLLDVASFPRRRAELALHLTGVIESRQALAGRIRRMLTRPLPKSARLGFAALAAVFLLGSVLLPMAGSNAPAAVQVGADGGQGAGRDAQDESATDPTEPDAAAGEANQRKAALSGRITDETGAPVLDAQLIISGGDKVHVRLESKTDDDGHYQFDEVPDAGEYRLEIKSQRWVGISYWDEPPILHLAPGAQIDRDFKLRRACRLMVRAVDEAGQPVRRVRILTASMADDYWRVPEDVFTDEQGVAIVGGLTPDSAEYVVATMHDDYGFEKKTLVLDDPDDLVSCDFVLRKGRVIQGTAVCSDGKPPAGWRIRAMPSWWRFGIFQGGAVIGDDGSFELPHIIPGKYDVAISIPSGESGSSPKNVLNEAELADVAGELAVKLDHLSPASMVYLSGTVRFDGPPSDDGFWIFANSADRTIHSSTYVDSGKKEFRVGPVPPGEYTLSIEDVLIERETLRVTAPADDLEVELKVIGQPRLKGIVVDAKTGEPVTDYRLRLIKQQTLGGGPNFVQDSNWRQFKGEDGAFDVTVVGPGVYVVLVAADGFAWTRSEPINTEERAGEAVRIEVSEGMPLAGMVIDEVGAPVADATVIPLPAGAPMRPSLFDLLATHGGAATNGDGRFVLEHLLPGDYSLSVTHRDYCFAIVENVQVGTDHDGPQEITLTQGGTVRGHVYDAAGRPQSGITVFFQGDTAYGDPRDEEADRFAAAVTDENGLYVAEHLPEQLCYVHRTEQWSALGVVRQCILPENGRAQTLNFGGQTRLSGRLLVNGAPLANRRLVLAGDSPRFGIFKAHAETAEDGSFAFLGIPPGDRTLYYALPDGPNRWARVQDIQVTHASTDLGAIDHRTGRVVVKLISSKEIDSNVRVRLQDYSPIWPHGNPVGNVARAEDASDTHVVEHVPVGRHELVVTVPGRFELRQAVEVASDNLDLAIEVPLPAGGASIGGRVDEAIARPGVAPVLKLWSADQRFLAYIRLNPDSTYSLGNIPAGDYVIREKDTRDAEVLLEVSLKEGEERTLDLTPENVSRETKPAGYLHVRVFTSDGVPVPCETLLEGSDGNVSPYRSRYGRQTFAASPGNYTLHARHPGFKPHRQTVEIKPRDAGNGTVPGYEVNVKLEPEEE